MKKMILLFLLTALLPMGVSAYDAYINGIYYNFSGDEAYVTYNKKNPDRNVSDYSGTVVIPETVTHRGQTYTVTGIGKDAFINCSDLTSVTIPESVTSIGNLAFAFCHGLTSITIPSSVTTLGDFAFQGCDNLSSFIIPNSVTYIGRNAFKQCSGMKSITFSNGVPTIGDDAFSSCYGLEKVIVPDLAAWCSISFSLFEANPLCYAHHLYSDETTEITDLTIPDGVSIKQYAFCHCSGLTSVTIPESVTTIGGSAFNGCDGLTSVSISHNVTVIGGGAFAYCTSLPSVTIPESVITIGGGAFYDCTGLTTVVIPNSVKFIGDRAFYDCSGLTSLIIGSGVTSIANDAFYGCYFTTDFVNNSALISSNNWGATLCDEETSDGLLIKGDTVVRCRPWANAITIPNSVTNIGERAFYECAGLTSITIPNNITSIGNYAFMGCINLNSINISCGVTSIGIYAFEDCRSLNSITIPEGITSISEGAFHNCMSLGSVTIPSSVTVINEIAFLDCNNLTEVYCFAEEVPSTSYDAFYVISTGFDDPPIAIESATLHVPAGYVEKYKATSPWNEFGNIVAIEEIAQEYFPEGTKWTEIRLDTMKYDSWYSKVGDEWVPNFETIEYRVQGEYAGHNLKFKKVYSNGPEWTDSLALLIYDNGYDKRVSASVLYDFEEYVPWPAEVYQFDWSVGKGLYYRDIMDANSTDILPELYYYGVIDEIKEGYFGGVRPLKYVDLNGKAPAMDDAFYDAYCHDTNGGRIIQGIGITEWNDGECLFGPPNPYFAMTGSYNDRHYRSMLVHFERDGEVLYNVWPEKEAIEVEPVTFTRDQLATIILPTAPDASMGKYYRLDRVENGQIIFEQELQPQAHIPYIIVPSEDFSIDPSSLDLEGLGSDAVSIDGIRFIGSYSREEFNCPEDRYIDIIDTTPDCQGSASCTGAFVVGMLRAYLEVDWAKLGWDDPIDHGGAKEPWEKMPIVLKDNPDGIDQMVNCKWSNGACYDLQGRKIVNSKSINGKSSRAIYIENGKKKVK